MSLGEQYFELIMEARRKQSKDQLSKRDSGMSMSMLGYCDRKCQYAEWGIPITNDETDEGLIRTAKGNFAHTRLQELSPCPKEFQEKKVYSEELNLGGHIDDYWSEHKCLIDYKTIASSSYLDKGLPKDMHVRQIHGYMAALKEEGIEVDKALLYYEPKGNCIKYKPSYHKSAVDGMPFIFDENGNKVKCLVVQVDWDKSIHEQNVVQVKRVKDACKAKQLLEGVNGDAKSKWQCNPEYCPYFDGCLGKLQAEFDAAISRLEV